MVPLSRASSQLALGSQPLYLNMNLFYIAVSREFFESLAPMKRKRRRSLSQLTPAETLSQLLLNLPGMAMLVVEFEISRVQN